MMKKPKFVTSGKIPVKKWVKPMGLIQSAKNYQFCSERLRCLMHFYGGDIFPLSFRLCLILKRLR